MERIKQNRLIKKDIHAHSKSSAASLTPAHLLLDPNRSEEFYMSKELSSLSEQQEDANIRGYTTTEFKQITI